MHRLLLEAVEQAKAAKNIVVLVCGMRPEDTHLALILTGFVSRPVAGIGKIIIVDLFAGNVANKVDDILEGVPSRMNNLVTIDKNIEKAMTDLTAVLGIP